MPICRFQLIAFTLFVVLPCSSEVIASKEPLLSVEQLDEEIIVRSQAEPTWKAVISVSRKASFETPGGGTIRAFHIPADNPESLVGTVPKHFAFGPWGIDDLEWRFVPKQGEWGIRKSIGVGARIEDLSVEHNKAKDQVVVDISGSWENVPKFTKQITFNPHGWKARIAADWDGPDKHYGMWWIWSLFRGDWMDNENVMIEDATHGPVLLPIAKENVFRIPEGIEIPYKVTFPLLQGPAKALSLKINEFGGESKRGPCYELWPEAKAQRSTDPEDTYKVFMPRWVSGRIEKREYVFDYEWKVVN